MSLSPHRDPEAMLRQTLQAWGGLADLWVFAYGSLIWNPEFEPAERRRATVYGWHRALKMWSRINRGTPERPGLVLALLPGGACGGVALRIPRREVRPLLQRLWGREMMTGVYDPLFLTTHTGDGPLRALAFTLSRKSPSYTGPLSDQEMRQIMRHSQGRYGTTRDYVEKTVEGLRSETIRDRALEALLQRYCKAC